MNNLGLALKTAGFNDKEAALYIAALNLGDALMSQLAKQAKLKRSTAYQVFEGLERRGLMGSFKMRSGTHFAATSPDALFSIRKKELEDLAGILPELKAFERKKGVRPKLAYFEGQEGYRAALEDSLKKPGNILRHIGSLTESHKTLGEKWDLDYYLPTRIKQGIRIHCLYFTDLQARIAARDHAKELREIKYVPKAFLFKGSSLIYDNKVVIVSGVEEMMTVIIESESIAEAEKQRFDLIWSLLT